MDFERNLSQGEGMLRIAAGFAAMTVGLFVFVVSPYGLAVSAVGLMVFATGYYSWCPIVSLLHKPK
ncbi:MAG: DUF2892 domain-containing protein [Candidatus Altiarchaeota archaeon]